MSSSNEAPVDADKTAQKTKFNLQIKIDKADSGVVDTVADCCDLSRGEIKDAMTKGALWLRPKKGGRQRLRKHSTMLRVGDRLELFYDPTILENPVPMLSSVADFNDYSIWYKPAGLLSQGTDYGDHCAIERQPALRAQRRQIFIVHRLDREVSGLMLIAHSKKAAAALSQLFQNHTIKKGYRALVLGDMATHISAEGTLEAKLDDKTARTHFKVLSYDAEHNQSLVQLRIESGRKHQIRRHLAKAMHPVMGDPRYGRKNKNRDGIKLVADFLAFKDPFNHKERSYLLDDKLRPF